MVSARVRPPVLQARGQSRNRHRLAQRRSCTPRPLLRRGHQGRRGIRQVLEGEGGTMDKHTEAE